MSRNIDNRVVNMEFNNKAFLDGAGETLSALDVLNQALDSGGDTDAFNKMASGVTTVADKFKNIPKGSRQVVLLSDGEDNEGNEKPAIKLAQKEEISIITVGIGSEEGAPIPEYVFGQLMGYKTDRSGITVISKRENKALLNIADQTNGSYVDGNNLENASTQVIDGLGKSATSTETMVKSNNAIHYYQYFLGVSLFFYLFIFLLNPKRDFNI